MWLMILPMCMAELSPENPNSDTSPEGTILSFTHYLCLSATKSASPNETFKYVLAFCILVYWNILELCVSTVLEH